MSTEDPLSEHHSTFSKKNLGTFVRAFSPSEKVFFLILLTIAVLSGLIILSRINNAFLVEIPTYGGSFREGVVGSPRFINPLLAQSDADLDLTSLIYSGLMKATPDGSLVYDLAKGYTVSEDGQTYTFTLRDDVTFHDGEPVTADDVVYTIQLVQDSTLKSPRRASWDGVVVKKVNDKEVTFTLPRPYAPFLQNLTLGILPEHIWKNAKSEEFTFSEFNIEPVGSGPYEVSTIRRNASGIPEYYELRSFRNYALGRPYIDTIRIYFFTNENFLIDAYINGAVDSVPGISTKNLEYAKLNKENINIDSVPLPRIFAVFLDQNQAPVFAHTEVREALNLALDKDLIIQDVLAGYGIPIDSPILPGILPETPSAEASSTIPAPDTTGTSTATSTSPLSKKDKAIALLEKYGWKINPDTGFMELKTKKGVEKLAFSLSTSNVPELKAVANIVKNEWAAIGADVTVKVFETGDLNQDVIRPRKYDALLFGEIVDRGLDLFAFWHSSQRNDPGLNIALYANITTDRLLEQIRTTRDKSVQLEKLAAFVKELKSDTPAIFIYAPDFIYLPPAQVHDVVLGSITAPSERFLNVNKWYIETDKVWKMFVQ